MWTLEIKSCFFHVTWWSKVSSDVCCLMTCSCDSMTWAVGQTIVNVSAIDRRRRQSKTRSNHHESHINDSICLHSPPIATHSTHQHQHHSFHWPQNDRHYRCCTNESTKFDRLCHVSDYCQHRVLDRHSHRRLDTRGDSTTDSKFQLMFLDDIYRLFSANRHSSCAAKSS